MNFQKLLTKLSIMAVHGQISRGIVDEGRIFSLGHIDNDEAMHGRVLDTVQGLKEHVGQPFGLNPWAYTFELSTFQQDGNATPFRLLGIVEPIAAKKVYSQELFINGDRMHLLRLQTH